MLLETSLGLRNIATHVSVVSRHAKTALCDYDGLRPITADYNRIEETLEKIDNETQTLGQIDLVVSWIHSSSPLAPFKIAEGLSTNVDNLDFYDVLGSAAANPAAPDFLKERSKGFKNYPNVKYHSVILGFAIEGKHSRWLTNSEIGNGVLSAIRLNSPSYVVGKTDPWKMRP